MTSAKPSATLGFVDRVEEMNHILDSLKAASAGEGQLLLVRGEAGSGKTRLLQEAATEAEKQGFVVGFGTALAESVVPYHPWKEVLEGLGLDAILEEAPPPKLLGLYLVAPDGSISIRVERGGEDVDDGSLVSSANILEEYVQGSIDSKDCEWAEGQLAAIQEEGNRVLAAGDADFTIGAVLEGQEDEKFLADLQALANTVVSIDTDMERDDPSLAASEAQFRQLLESRKYEGIDYTKDDPKLRQARFFEHVTLGLSRKAGTSPVCVVIDDLQWADPSSLALLHYVARNTHKTGVLLLGTYRVEEAKVRPHLRDALKGMEQEELLAEMDLKGLSREDLPDLAKSFIGSHALPGAILDLLWRETRGFPLFIREVLRGLEEDNAIEVQDAIKRLVQPLDQLALPERVREVIRVRLDRLPKADRRLLDAAATCGTRFTAALVARVAGETEGKVLNGLSAIADVYGLLRPTQEGFAFDHPAVQEVVYGDVRPETRQTYHKEAAEWLELAGGPIEDIGEHYYHGRDHRAVARLSEAASTACTRYANDEAIRFYTEALDVAEGPEEQKSILQALAGLHLLTGDFSTALETSRRVLGMAEDETGRASTLLSIAEAYTQMGEFDDALQACTQALDTVRGEECTEEAQAMYLIALIHLEQGGNLERESDRLERSLEIWENLRDARGVASALTTLGISRWLRGDFDAALAYHERSLAIRERMGDQPGSALSLAYIGLVYNWRGQYDEAWGYFGRSLEIGERIGDLYGNGQCHMNFGIIHERRGDLEEALDALEKGLKITMRAGIQWGAGVVLSWVGDVHRRMGDFRRAAESLNKSREIHERIGSKVWQARTYRCLSELHLARGEFPEALSYAREALDLATRLRLSWMVADARRAFGCIHREMENWSDADENFSESIRLFEQMGMRDWLGESHYEFGLLWKARGDSHRAVKHLKAAQQAFGELGLGRKAERVGRALAGVGDTP